MPLGFRTWSWGLGVGRTFFSFPDRTTEPHAYDAREYGARRTRAAGPTTDGGYSVRVI